MEPSKKSDAMEKVLTKILGQDRREVIKANKCMDAPFGCGGKAHGFRDELSTMEYQISGLCQACQDTVFRDGILGPLR